MAKKRKYSKWELDGKIDLIIKSNIKEIPWEGTDVDKPGLKQSILELLWELAPEYNYENSNITAEFSYTPRNSKQ